MMATVLLFRLFGNRAWADGITSAWISAGGIWMFGGLIIMTGRHQKQR